MVRKKEWFTPFASGTENPRLEWIRKENVHNELTISAGASYCLGKQLAMMEMRMVLSRLIGKYDVSFAPGEDGTGLIGDAVESSTIWPGNIRLVFKPR